MKETLSLIKQTFQEWQEDRVPMLAASLSYYTVFSLAPLLIIIIAVLGLVLGQSDVQATVIRQVRDIVGNDGAEFIQTMIENQQQQGGGVFATILGVALLLLGASGVFIQLQNALNAIWGVTPAQQKGGVLNLVKRRLLAFAMIFGIGFLLLLSLLIPAILSVFQQLLPGAFPGSEFLWQLVTFVLSLGIITVLFAVIFQYLPDVDIRWRDVWVGAAVTALLFTIGKTLLGLYLGRGAVSSAYGAAGSLVLILLWVYYSAQILLLGAEFTQVYARRHGEVKELQAEAA